MRAPAQVLCASQLLVLHVDTSCGVLGFGVVISTTLGLSGCRRRRGLRLRAEGFRFLSAWLVDEHEGHSCLGPRIVRLQP